MPDFLRLDGKIALVTGGASGIGEATVRLFAEAGAHVLIVDRDEERANELAAAVPDTEAHACDITDEAAVKQLFAPLKKLDILFNCAGVGLVGNVEETELADLQRLFRVNVEGTYLMTKAAMPLLLEVRGSVLNMGSVAGLVVCPSPEASRGVRFCC